MWPDPSHGTPLPDRKVRERTVDVECQARQTRGDRDAKYLRGSVGQFLSGGGGSSSDGENGKHGMSSVLKARKGHPVHLELR